METVFDKLFMNWIARGKPLPSPAKAEVQFSTIQSCHGTSLCFDRATGVLFHDNQPADTAAGLLTACQFLSHPGALFLFDASTREQSLEWLGTHWRAKVLALRVGQTDQPGRFFLCHPLTGRHLSAEAPVSGTAGLLSVNRTEVGPWELFDLQPAAAHPPIPRQQSITSSLAAMLAFAAAGDMAGMLGAVGRPDGCFEAVAALQPLAVLEQFARRLAAEPTLSQALANACPTDPWAVEALPALARHKANSAVSEPIRAIGPSLDRLARAGFDGQYASVMHLFNGFARREMLPKRGTCIIATCRNEGPYLLEWLAYHFSVGIEHVFLYSNDNQDGSDLLLRALAQAGVITWISNAVSLGTSPQYKAYGHAMQILPEVLDYRWALVIDIDEFFVFNTNMFSSITDYLRWQETQPVDAVGLSWLNYGPNRETRLIDLPVHRRFTRRQPYVDRHVKSIFRPQRFMHAHCHYPIWTTISCGNSAVQTVVRTRKNG